MSTKAQKKLQAAIVDFLCLDPFFGTLALSLPFKEDATCDTAWVNGRNIGYNPTFIESLTFEETKGVLRHEVLHVAMGHPWRREGREFEQWNAACDLAINPDCGALPKGTLVPDASQKGKSAEWIFARLPQSKPGKKQGQGGQGQGQGKGTPQPGEVRDAPTGKDEDGHPAPTEGEWKQRTAEALQAAKMQGALSGGLERMIESAIGERIDSKALLLRFMTERTKADYAWTKPNVRFLSQGLYLPGLESYGMGEVSILVDTSGSVTGPSLAYARQLIEDVMSECEPAAVTVYYVDSKVCAVDRFERGECLTWQPKGGGGTNFTSFFEDVERDGTSVCVIGISDLYATFPSVVPTIPTIWLATTNASAPFGEVVPLLV